MSNYRYIGSSSRFHEGDKIKIQDEETRYEIGKLIKEGHLAYNTPYIFVEYNGYMMGSNYLTATREDGTTVDLPEWACDRYFSPEINTSCTE